MALTVHHNNNTVANERKKNSKENQKESQKCEYTANGHSVVENINCVWPAHTLDRFARCDAFVYITWGGWSAGRRRRCWLHEMEQHREKPHLQPKSNKLMTWSLLSLSFSWYNLFAIFLKWFTVFFPYCVNNFYSLSFIFDLFEIF